MLPIHLPDPPSAALATVPAHAHDPASWCCPAAAPAGPSAMTPASWCCSTHWPACCCGWARCGPPPHCWTSAWRRTRSARAAVAAATWRHSPLMLTREWPAHSTTAAALVLALPVALCQLAMLGAFFLRTWCTWMVVTGRQTQNKYPDTGPAAPDKY